MNCLRPYQEHAVEKVFAHFAAGVRRVLLVLPTGGGKTVIGSEIIARALKVGRNGIFFAHRREIIEQSFVKLVRHGLSPQQIGVVMSGVEWRLVDEMEPTIAEMSDGDIWRHLGRRRPQAKVQVASVDTFRNRIKPAADLIVFDEAHRALAKSYSDIQHAYPDAWHLGLTATPWRADGRGLEDAYNTIVVVSTFEELIEQGYLVRPVCYGTAKKLDLRGVRKTGTDWNESELAKAVDKRELIGDIVEHWIARGEGNPTFCFAASIEHSKNIVARFVASGIAAVHVDANTDLDVRAAALRDLRSGAVKIVSNVAVFTEGTDVPEVKTIVDARPTLSEGLWMQKIGRGARPHGGREHFVVLDHAGNCEHFGRLPHWPIEVSLTGRKKRNAEPSLPPVKTCPTCLAMIGVTLRACPCGHTWTEAECEQEPPEEKAGSLELIEDAPKPLTRLQQQRLDEWNALVLEWSTENERRQRHRTQRLVPGGWCLTQWRNRTGQSWPPKGSHGVPRLTAEQLTWNASVREPPRRGQILLEEWAI